MLALLATPAAAQVGPPSPTLAEGEEVEVQLTADLNADGREDLAYIARKEDSRELRVVVTSTSEVKIGENPPQVLTLDPYPLGDGQLSTQDSGKGKVLVFEELTGGTTALSSTYRYRWDAKLDAMQLIGLDATLYSRTFAHDGVEASWNLLTGDLVTRTLRLNKGEGDQAYNPVGEKKTKRALPPIRLEDSPRPEGILPYPEPN
jgi:hypothetical protein